MAASLLQFFNELRRRRVFRVTLVYGAVAWLLVEMADVVSPALDLPWWTARLVVVLVLLGFPMAVLLAWAFDLTPSGVERTQSQPETSAAIAAASPEQERVAAAPAWTGGEGPWGAAADAPARRPRPGVEREGPDGSSSVGMRPDATRIRSVAAVPFVNPGSDDGNEYFTDGMTEELINALTRIPGLRVAARTSSFAFKGRAMDVREIARALGVQGVIEGSVRIIGKRMRLSIRLVDAADGQHIWSDRFDREIDDVFAVQDEIAGSIVKALELELAGVPEHWAGRPTRDIESYHQYLKGRYFWNRRTPKDLLRSAAAFREAIERDPTSALAHAGLADAYTILLDYGVLSPKEALPRAREAAQRAAELDDGLAETHTSVALVRQFEWDWVGAEASFRRALELNPGYATGRHRYALCLAWSGRHAEAEREIMRAADTDPLSPIIGSSAGLVLYYARRYAEAVGKARGVLQIDPRFPMADLVLALSRAQLGESERAVAHLEAALAHGGENPAFVALLAHAYGRSGHTARARELESRLEETARTQYVSGYYRALPPLGLAEHDNALVRLEQAREERAAHMVYLAVDPILDPLRDDPRFARLLDAVGRSAG